MLAVRNRIAPADCVCYNYNTSVQCSPQSERYVGPVTVASTAAVLLGIVVSGTSFRWCTTSCGMLSCTRVNKSVAMRPPLSSSAGGGDLGGDRGTGSYFFVFKLTGNVFPKNRNTRESYLILAVFTMSDSVIKPVFLFGFRQMYTNMTPKKSRF